MCYVPYHWSKNYFLDCTGKSTENLSYFLLVIQRYNTLEMLGERSLTKPFTPYNQYAYSS